MCVCGPAGCSHGALEKKSKIISFLSLPFASVPALVWSLTAPQGFAGPLGSPAEAAGCGNGACLWAPLLPNLPFARASSVNAASAGQSDPRDSSL